MANHSHYESTENSQGLVQQEDGSSSSMVPIEKLTSLTCQERIDCGSPEIFNESLPGAWDMKKEFLSFGTMEKASSRFRTELDPEDVKLVNELGQLSADKLMEYVRNLQASSLSLAEEEARQFTRARCLNIFGKNASEKQQ
uniref:Uncharacterized protein n=1 Tax=Ditylenchus dipsaci TaxID=166011 RepID=A0A915E3I0_9BILA